MAMEGHGDACFHRATVFQARTLRASCSAVNSSLYCRVASRLRRAHEETLQFVSPVTCKVPGQNRGCRGCHWSPLHFLLVSFALHALSCATSCCSALFTTRARGGQTSCWLLGHALRTGLQYVQYIQYGGFTPVMPVEFRRRNEMNVTKRSVRSCRGSVISTVRVYEEKPGKCRASY